MEGQGHHVQYEDEINLYEYFQVLWKRKVLITAVFLASVISAGVISYTMTPLYKVSAMLTLTWLDEKGNPQSSYAAPAANVTASIENGALNRHIYNNLRLDPTKVSISFKVSQPKNSNVIQIDYYTPDPSQGEAIITELIRQLQSVYGERSIIEQQKIDNSIEAAKSQVKMVGNQKNLMQNQKITIANKKSRILRDIESGKRRIDLLKESEKTIKKQTEEVENNTKLMMEQRNELLKEEGSKMDAATKILYLNSIQQNIIYLDRLNTQMDQNKMNQENEKNDIEKNEILLKDKDTELMDLETKIRDKDNESQGQIQKVKDLELSKRTIEGLAILQPAIASTGPVKPEKKKNMAIAGVSSIFLGIFLAFVAEFIRKNKSIKQA